MRYVIAPSKARRLLRVETPRRIRVSRPPVSRHPAGKDIEQPLPVLLDKSDLRPTSGPREQQMAGFRHDGAGRHESLALQRQCGQPPFGNVMAIVSGVGQGHPQTGISDDHAWFREARSDQSCNHESDWLRRCQRNR